jgi:hypothetical protein
VFDILTADADHSLFSQLESVQEQHQLLLVAINCSGTAAESAEFMVYDLNWSGST